MKKSLFIALFLVLAVARPVYASTINDQYISLITQVIALLQQKIVVLEAQLASLQSIQTTHGTVIDPMPTIIVAGSSGGAIIDPMPVTPIIVQDTKISYVVQTPEHLSSNYTLSPITDGMTIEGNSQTQTIIINAVTFTGTKQEKHQISVTTDYPDMPSNFTFNGNNDVTNVHESPYFRIGKYETQNDVVINNGNEALQTVGLYNFTLTNVDTGTSISFKVNIK